MLHPNENKRQLVQRELAQMNDDPRLSNRGVIDPFAHRVFSHLDYFSAVYPSPVKARKGQPLDHWAGNDLLVMERETRGVQNWRYGAELFPAGHLFWGDEDEAMGSYMIMSGADLAMLRTWHKLTDDELLARITRNATSVSRLDFAVNIEAGDPRETMRAFDAKEVRTRVKSAREIVGHGSAKGYTAYFGSTSSKKMLRVYDKAKELKDLFEVLTRIELQTRKKVATRLADVMCSKGVKDAGKAAIRGFVSFPGVDWYNEALEGKEVAMNLLPAKETSFERWLQEQVKPAIEKRWKAGDQRETIMKFAADVMKITAEEDEAQR